MAGRWGHWGHAVALDGPQRRVVGVGLALLVGYGVVRLLLNPVSIDDPQPPQGDRSAELADRLDPNTADAAELAALPGIGRRRADALVARRDALRRRDPAAVAFASADDLYYVPGFARSMVEQLSPYLVFPATRPTTAATPEKTRATGRTSP